MMVTQEAAKAASTFMSSLKEQPLSLALVVMNFALIGFVWMQGTAFNTQRQENVRLFLDVQKEVQKLLAQCIVPPPSQFQQRGDLKLFDEQPLASRAPPTLGQAK
jgi:hypothetical protein